MCTPIKPITPIYIPSVSDRIQSQSTMPHTAYTPQSHTKPETVSERIDRISKENLLNLKGAGFGF